MNIDPLEPHINEDGTAFNGKIGPLIVALVAFIAMIWVTI